MVGQISELDPTAYEKLYKYVLYSGFLLFVKIFVVTEQWHHLADVFYFQIPAKWKLKLGSFS